MAQSAALPAVANLRPRSEFAATDDTLGILSDVFRLPFAPLQLSHPEQMPRKALQIPDKSSRISNLSTELNYARQASADYLRACLVLGAPFAHISLRIIRFLVTLPNSFIYHMQCYLLMKRLFPPKISRITLSVSYTSMAIHSWKGAATKRS